MIKKLSKNVLSLFLGEGLGHFLGFIVNAYIARILSVEGFGIINYGLAFLTYLLLFSNMGLTTLGVREIAKDKKNTTIVSEITGTRISLTFILCITFLILLLVIPGDALTRKIIFLYLLTGIPYAFYLEFVFQGREEMEFIGIGRVIHYSGYLILVIIFLKTKGQILSVPLSYLGGYFFATVFLFIVFLRKYNRLSITIKPINSYHLLISALPIGLATIIYQAVMNFPVICLGIFHNQKDVGLFSAGFKIIILLLIIERIFYYLFFPIFSKQAKQNLANIGKSFAFFSQLVTGITFVITIVGLILTEKIITIIYGTDFVAGTGILRILLLYFMIAPLNTIWGYGLIALNQEKKFFNVIVVIAIMNLLLTVILGYLFKGIGVAFAILISESYGLFLMYKNLNSVVQFRLFTFLNVNEIKNLLQDQSASSSR
ncbi:MAG: flippase [candidate division WOR-3 bacterium]